MELGWEFHCCNSHSAMAFVANPHRSSIAHVVANFHSSRRESPRPEAKSHALIKQDFPALTRIPTSAQRRGRTDLTLHAYGPYGLKTLPIRPISLIPQARCAEVSRYSGPGLWPSYGVKTRRLQALDAQAKGAPVPAASSPCHSNLVRRALVSRKGGSACLVADTSLRERVPSDTVLQAAAYARISNCQLSGTRPETAPGHSLSPASEHCRPLSGPHALHTDVLR